MGGGVRVAILLVVGLFLFGGGGETARPADYSVPPVHALVDALNSLRPNAHEVFTVKNLDLRRDAIHLTLEQGQIAFFNSVRGEITGAVFTGRGHILAVPRDITEKASLARFLNAPLLDEEFHRAYLRFDDKTSAELHSQLNAAGAVPVEDPSISEEWDETVAALNPWHSLRIIRDILSEHPLPYFYAGLLGDRSGPFDVMVDERREEQVLLGQPTVVNEQTMFDVWGSFRRANSVEPTPPFNATSYQLDTTVQPDLNLVGTATLALVAKTGGERAIPLEFSSALRVDSVTDDAGTALEFFQGEPADRQEIAGRGNDALTIVMPSATTAGRTFQVKLTYRGHVINNAGNGVYFVGEHGSWYPHMSGPDHFASYEMKFRWPRQLQLVATGQKLEEHEDGDWRESHWRSEKPVTVAGFNLGDYRVATVESPGIKVDLFANSQLEQALQRQYGTKTELTPVPKTDLAGNVKPALEGSVSTTNFGPNPTAILHSLGEEIAQATQFFSKFGGAFPYERLRVSQVPGTFAQGWPGLLYLPTFSFLSRESQRRAGLSVTTQEHFTEIVPYHELAHQWWGNLVSWHSYRDQWICEGLANYVALMFAGSRKDSGHVLNDWLVRYRNSLASRIPGKEGTVDSAGPLALGFRLRSSLNPVGYEEVTYAKATWVFHMIRMMLREPNAKDPDERFTLFLRTLTDSHRDSVLSTEDLERAVQKVMLPSMDLEGGHSMGWFFDQWVRGTGMPHYKVEFSVQPSGDQFVVKGVLHQTGVPTEFLARVPLFASRPGSKPILLGTIATNGADTTFRFVTRTAPKHILIDYELTLLCQVD